ncbi:hypothetical protein H072_6319 [Dactylellina haptotyla CBS 200.50]|uniref:Enterotoxin n=1 Tax=Dactylellina haptotyla (strain CBS 200.50) TaxID=1284197 RepID=S8AAA4_DACHA|nr:hypothetical protein H072_6319 [Dactylellina haptotyla CBS 200.50]
MSVIMFIICLSLFLGGIQAQDLPEPEAGIERFPNGTRIFERWWLVNCTTWQERVFYEAVTDAEAILATVKKPNFNTMTAQEYLGAQNRPFWNAYQEKVPKVLAAAYDWVSRHNWWYGPYVYCNVNPDNHCNQGTYDRCPVEVLYPGGDPGDSAQLYMVLCDSWFEKPSLSWAVNRGKFCLEHDKSHETLKLIFNMLLYENRALWLVHAVFHVREVFTALTVNKGRVPKTPGFQKLMLPFPHHDWIQPWSGISKAVLGPWQAKAAALNIPEGDWMTPGPLGNPTNYGLYALAEYLTIQLGDYPDRPYFIASNYTGFPPLGTAMCSDFETAWALGQYTPNQTEVAHAPWVFTPQSLPTNLPDMPFYPRSRN